MRPEQLKEQEREKITDLLCQSIVEYAKYYRKIDEKILKAKTEDERQKILDDSISCENVFTASFLQSNGLTFKVIAKYEDLDGGYTFRCSHCHHTPTATYDDNWAFTPHCGTCGAEMKNAEELREKQREKNGFKEV
jgi:hypothetical protein